MTETTERPLTAGPAALAPRRLAYIAALLVATLIPLFMISGLVEDRESRQASVEAAIAKGWGPRQIVGSPTLAIPVTGKDLVTSYVRLQPKTLDVAARLTPERRSRGIYGATVYTATIEMRGTFAQSDALKQAERDWTTPRLGASLIAIPVLGLSGIEAADGATIGGTTVAWQRCADLLGASACGNTDVLVASADTEAAKTGDVAFTATLHLRGTSVFALDLAGKQVAATIAGAWRTPSFTGDALPTQTTRADRSFEAHWRHDEIARARPSDGNDVVLPGGDTVGVDLLEPISIYQTIARASKYAPVIVTLAFTTYFLLELLAGIRVGLLQYALLGASLSLFTLLLLSASEILGYPAGYALSAALVVTQASLYTASVARRRRPAVVFAGALAGLFGFLYVLLGLESYALVVGAVALFLVLSIVMAATQSAASAVAP